LRKQYKDMAATTDELAVSLNRAPSEAEVADKMGIRLVHLRKLMSDLRPVSNSRQSPNSEELVSLDPPCEVKAQPDSITERAELRTALQEAVRTLPRRHQRIVMLYHYHDLSIAKIAKRFGLHESRVSQIRRAALEQMGRTLRAKGITSSRLFLS
jgi:RNA polymerase sigma factor for flagellar operon FliA